MTRPTFEELMRERTEFIGPPPPPTVPKFTRPGDRDAVYAMMLADLVAQIACEAAAYKSK
jgi:hypothetical protein